MEFSNGVFILDKGWILKVLLIVAGKLCHEGNVASSLTIGRLGNAVWLGVVPWSRSHSQESGFLKEEMDEYLVAESSMTTIKQK